MLLYKLNLQAHVMLTPMFMESGVVTNSSFLYLVGRLLFSQASKMGGTWRA